MNVFYRAIFVFLFTFSGVTYAQQINTDDVGSIDSVITALYDVISGPAGQRDWDRFSSLFKEGATMGTISEAKDGTLHYVSMTPVQYIESNDEYFKKNGFWEEEIAREVFQFGEIATVQTSYKIKTAEDGEVTRRGVNTVQLVYDQNCWWITNITWNNEREDNKIPQTLLKDTL
ncbi:nuclear transport factor 2 family protein [Fodinibius sp. SL11]|uniref:nuclear transport factor 2 family protein n=1 Tax=Fodinibius sp. SL11 TaxID=3425690 RepID=UPI003F8846E4